MAKPIHSNIRVIDEERSIAFYRQAFDLEVVDRVPFDDFTLVFLRDRESEFEVAFAKIARTGAGALLVVGGSNFRVTMGDGDLAS